VRPAALVAVFCLVPLFQTPSAQQQPAATFRAGIDLLTVESAVFDKDGKPLRDLQPGDFTVTVDGKPRAVRFARFYGTDASGVPEATIAVAPGAAPAAHVSKPPTAAGRVVVFVIDRDTIRSGGEKALLQASSLVLDALSPADAVGLVGLPNGRVDLTREHGRVREGLARMTGTMPTPPWRWFITWDEAEGIERRDKQALDVVYARECREGQDITPPDSPDKIVKVAEGCDKGVVTQANEMLLTARSQAQSTLAALGTLAGQLAPLQGPKHIVFLSGGLRFDQQLLPEYEIFTRQVAASGVLLHTVHVDQPSTDTATQRREITSAFGSREMATGLTTISGLTGGSFFEGVGAATGVFERIGAELANYYELGVETAAGDADGKVHEIRVEVSRPGASVRARKQIVAGNPAAVARSADPVKWLLQQPTDVASLPIAVTAYTTRGDEASTLRVLLSGEIGAPLSKGPVDWGFIVLNEGNAVANGRARIDGARPAPWAVTTSAKLTPGTYRLRFVAADADGRAGVADVPLTVGLRAAGDLQISDLIVGTADGGRLQPRARLGRGVPATALIELYSNDPARLEKTTAALEIIPAGSGEPVQRYLMARRSSPASGAILIAEGEFVVDTLPPGRYIASVVALVDNQPVGRVSRAFEVK
jgi:VWFA-related protein